MQKKFTLFALMVLCLLIQVSPVKATNKTLISDSIDVLHYTINLNITDISGQQISGFTTLKIVPIMSSINHISLYLLKLTADSIFINSSSTGFTHNDSLLSIPLSISYTPSDTFLVTIYYHGHPIIDPSGWGGFYFKSGVAFNLGVGFADNPHVYGRVWYPCIDDFVDRATYDCSIRVINGNTAVCGGTLVSTDDNGDGTSTFHWNLRDEIPTYLVSVAVGSYVKIPDVFQGTLGTIPIGIYAKPADSLKAVGSFTHLKEALLCYETAFGPYRWERVGYVIVPFSSGAMEHATNIAFMQGCMDGSTGCDDIMVHELSHHWFGNLVTCRTPEDMWLNEGWASYCEPFFHEYFYGYDTYKLTNRQNHKDVIYNAHLQDSGYYPVSGIPHEITYGSTVYNRGASIAHTLRGYMGDEKFFPGIRSYLNDFAFKDASSIDFRDHLTATSGINLNDFFDAWVFTSGYVSFTLHHFESVQNGQNYDVTVQLTQKARNRDIYSGPNSNTVLANSNKVDVTFIDQSWNMHTETVQFSGVSGSGTFSLPFAPVLAIVDMEEKISDASIDQYQTIKSTGLTQFAIESSKVGVYTIVDSAFVRIQHNIIRPDGFTPPVDGLIISDTHFWRVDALSPSVFKANIYFEYSTNAGQLDHWLANSSSPIDSLTLLYRKDATFNWEPILFTKQGTTNFGNLYSDTVRTGDYAFGFYDKVRYDSLKLAIVEYAGQISKLLEIFPNPSNGAFTIRYQLKKTGGICVYSLSGNMIFEQQNLSGNNETTWSPPDSARGVYIVKLFEGERVLSEKKIVYN